MTVGAEGSPGTLIPPFSWVFSSPRQAFWGTFVAFVAFWLLLVVVRLLFLRQELIFWSHELMLLAAGGYAIFLGHRLTQGFFQLQSDLRGRHAEVDALLDAQQRRFHQRRWLVAMPPVVAIFAVSLRFIAAEGFRPFQSAPFEYCWLIWLFCCFCLLLHVSVLVGRYSEVIKQIGEAGSRGLVGRADLTRLSGFYFRIALLSSIFFVLSVFVVFGLHMIYTYSGSIWPGYALLRQMPRWILGRQVHEIKANSEMVIEVFLVLLLYASASFSSFLYFFLPQWGVHRILVDRKKRVIDSLQEKLDRAENDLIADPNDAALQRFSQLTSQRQSVDTLPEWPFSGEHFSQTVLLIVVPGVLVLAKEVFLETFVGLLTK